MKINIDKGVGVKSNSESQKKIQMKINANMGMALVTRYLYSNPIQTLTQEYLCNGRDAIRAAKKKNPIEVTLPTRIDPTLKIRDFGQGISDDLMENVFCVLGESEKRKSDELTGGFGIGAKSGWAYTDSFTIRSIVDGVSKLYLAHMGDTQSGTLEEVSSSKTTEPNGVEIQINVQEKDITAFHKAVYRATQFWDVKPVIKGVLPEEIPPFWKSLNPLFSNENWAIYQTKDLPENIADHNVNTAQIIVAVDKIPYRLNNSFNEFSIVKKIKGAGNSWGSNDRAFLRHDVTLVIFVNNNDVEVAANREELNNNDFSKKQIDKILTEAYDQMVAYQKQKEAGVKNIIELIELQKTERAGFNSINGKVFQSNGIKYALDNMCRLTAESENFDTPLIFERYNMSKNRSSKFMLSREDARILNFTSKGIEIYLKDTNDGSGLTREKIRSLFNTEKDSWKEKEVYVLDRPTSSDKEKEALKLLAKELEIKLLSSVKMPDKVRAKFTRPSSKGKIVIHQLSVGTGSYNKSLIEKTIYQTESELANQNWLFIETNEGKKQFPKMWKKNNEHWQMSNSTIASIIPFFLSRGYNLCTVTTKQADKVKKLSNFKCFDSFIADAEKNIRLTNDEEKVIRSQAWRGLPSWIYVLRNDIKSVSDGLIQEMFEYDNKINIKLHTPLNNAARVDLPYFIRNQILAELIAKIQQEVESKYKAVSKIQERYPLANSGNESNKKDLLLYINTKYKALNKKKE